MRRLEDHGLGFTLSRMGSGETFCEGGIPSYTFRKKNYSGFCMENKSYKRKEWKWRGYPGGHSGNMGGADPGRAEARKKRPDSGHRAKDVLWDLLVEQVQV